MKLCAKRAWTICCRPLVSELRKQIKAWRDARYEGPFRLDYVNDAGGISNYHPDSFVKVADGSVFIVEAKGREDVEVAPKMLRLKQWIEDINRLQSDVKYDFVYVDEESFKRHRPKSFTQLTAAFQEYE